MTSSSPKLVALLAASLAGAWSVPAWSQTPCDIPPAGEVLCEDVVIDSSIQVIAYDPSSATPTGYLHIRARSITITATGDIDATGSGLSTQYEGAEPTNGGGQGGGQRGVQPFGGAPAPGGGGSHIGSGGVGITNLTLCTSSATALGGAAYDDALAPLFLMSPFDAVRSMGSAGGASYCGDSGNQLRAGGRGGGVVMLTAGTIEIAGRVQANGEGLEELGGNLLKCGPGAGAGGAIVLRSHNLSFGANAQLSAIGGESPRTQTGDPMMDATNSWGGGGGGGLITLLLGDPSVLLPDMARSDVSGGMADCPEGLGGEGAVAALASPACLDADRDGFESDACGGPDCHDGNIAIHPEGIEICDGADNNCDGEVDEDPDSLCPSGSGTSCIDGSCSEPMGTGGSGGVPAPPEVVLGGGLCTTTFRQSRVRPWWMLSVLALAWLRRRSRHAGPRPNAPSRDARR